jgi:hypothetical protein
MRLSADRAAAMRKTSRALREGKKCRSVSAGTGSERRARREGARAHAEVRRKRRGHVAQGIAAGGAEVAADHVGADPVAARFAVRVDALHGGAGHVLHL